MPDTVLVSRTDYGTNNRRERHTVLVGTSQWILVNGRGSAIAVSPGSGGTMSVQYTQSPVEFVQADNANGTSTCIALTWPNGTVSAASDGILRHATAVRFIATSAAGAAEIAEQAGL